MNGRGEEGKGARIILKSYYLITNFLEKIINGNIHGPFYACRISLSKPASEPIKNLLHPTSPN